jgi:polysaccharide deacetylase family protein (PEP-CTERM system associated)
MTRLVNAMTVDVEDYFHASAFDRVVSRESWAARESRVVPNTARLLEVFERCNVRATFFILGWVAERHPQLVRDIAAAGHEVASHGFYHQLIYTLTLDQFRQDVRRAKATIEDACGRQVRGYRAPSFSIVHPSLWALDVLIEEGYAYDSSIFPIRHDRYGIPDAPRLPHVIDRNRRKMARRKAERDDTPRRTRADLPRRIVEVPAATVRLGNRNLPIAGGGYFRLLPYAWTRWGMARANQAGEPVVFYIHPWEVDPGQPRLPVGRLTAWRHYGGLGRTLGRLERLCADFAFDTIGATLAGQLADDVAFKELAYAR